MASLRKVDVVWTGLAGAPWYSQFFFDYQAGKAGAAVTGLTTFLTAIKTNVLIGASAAIQDEQTIIDVGTGNPTGVETSPGGAAISSSGAGPGLPWATQGVLRLTTDMYIGARRLRGRLFLPAPPQSAGASVPSASYISNVSTAGNNLVTASAAFGGWMIYSRTHTAAGNVSAASCWNQYGVLRSRRT